MSHEGRIADEYGTPGGQFDGYNMPRFHPDYDDQRNPGSHQNLSNDPLGADRTGDLVGAMSSHDAFAPMAVDGVAEEMEPPPQLGTDYAPEFLSGTAFDQGTYSPYNGISSWQFIAPDTFDGSMPGFPKTAATYNPLSGFGNIPEAESILPWLYGEDEEDDRRIDRNYLDELFKDQAAPYNKLLPSVNLFGGRYIPAFGGPLMPNAHQETTGGGYDFPSGSVVPHSDFYSQVGAFTQ